uniref:Follistatin-related protein 1 n=1 Tax=Cyprinus carpio TaxID=7962 RepID=A0A8C2BFN3_CYPCA
MLRRDLQLCVLLMVFISVFQQETQSKSKVCANVFCGAGRECAVNEKGEPSCLCIEQCKPHKRSVCGSNGKTYRNHCELHRDACLTGLKIQVAYDGHCKVVCYVNYDSGDSQLDSAELLKFIQHNETAVQMNSYAEEENNRLLRSLCVDALIELSDENADWKLSFDEFLNCLKPGFNPPEKKCALEDETYEDGAETQVECNRCVCACGNWVCTAMTCDEKSPVIDTDGDQEMTEEEWTRRVAELNKHQVTKKTKITTLFNNHV